MPSLVQSLVNRKLKERWEALQSSRNRSNSNHCLFDYTPLPGGQTEFWDLVKLGNRERTIDLSIPYRACLMRGGIGSGKSFAGAAFACSRAYYDPSSRGLISANDYPQLETSTLVALAEFCDRFSIPLDPVCDRPDATARLIANRRFCTIFSAPILVVAASKFGGTTEKASQSGRGLQVRWAWLDEWAYAEKMAWDTLNGRLGRGGGKLRGHAVVTSSINRITPYNWCYDLFDDPDRPNELKELYRSIGCLTAQNTSLDADYIASLTASYSEELRAIELRGEYATSTEGLVFRHFNRNRHTDGGIGINRDLPIHLSFDFNRNPATCLVAQTKGQMVRVIREFYMRDSDTFSLGSEVRAYLDSLAIDQPVYLHGDASGSSKTANSKESNWSIIVTSMSGLNWVRKWGSANPSITDSVHSTNNLFAADRVLIHPQCKELVKDLEQLKWTADGRGEIDKKADLMRSHLGDTLRYLAHDLFPFSHQSWRQGLADWRR